MKSTSPICWLAGRVADTLQKFYEIHRVPETWGTPTVSKHVFQALRHKGFRAAGRELVQRLRLVGRPGLSTTEKMVALILGVGIVAIADHLLHEEQQPITRRVARTFSKKAWKPAIMLYTIGAALLVAANDDGSTGGSGDEGDWDGSTPQRNPDGSYSYHYEGSENSVDYHAYGRPDEGDGRNDRWSTDAWDDLDQSDDPKHGRN